MSQPNEVQIGLIGLATMGANLARNISNQGFSICVYNRTTKKTEEFIKEFGSEKLIGSKNIEEFISKIDRPRKIIILVKSGKAVDSVIAQITPLLDKGDLIIECGNSQYQDTIRRSKNAEKEEILYLGCGVSGGEEGALKGPSIMPGGSPKAYQEVKEILEKIAAKDFNQKPCVSYIGKNGAGHFIKTVHNGIEYGVMQLMAEAYEIFRTVYKLSAPEIAKIFQKYNQGKLQSYLFEISIEVLNQKDQYQDGYLIDFILDKAGQKGTGRWTAIESLQKASGLSTISEAVYARINSGDKKLRQKLSKIYPSTEAKPNIPLEEMTNIIEDGLYSAMLIAYAQGYDLIQKSATEEKWQINLSEVSRIWQGGCIIRANILETLHQAFKESKETKHFFEIPSIAEKIKKNIPQLRKLVSFATKNGISIPSLAASQSYFDTITKANGSTNLIQGLRDYFGAHTYKRTDKKGDFHTEWQELS